MGGLNILVWSRGENMRLTLSQEHSWETKSGSIQITAPMGWDSVDAFSPWPHRFVFSKGLLRYKVLGQQHCKSKHLEGEGTRTHDFVALGFSPLFLFWFRFCIGLFSMVIYILQLIKLISHTFEHPIMFSAALFSCDDISIRLNFKFIVTFFFLKYSWPTMLY